MLRFIGNGGQQKSPPFSMQNSQATSKKKSPQAFWRAGKVTVRASKLASSGARTVRHEPLNSLSLFGTQNGVGERKKRIFFENGTRQKVKEHARNPNPSHRGNRN